MKEANWLANQFEKCALKEKENAKKQTKESRGYGGDSKSEKESKAKIRLLQDERMWKKSPRSPRRDTYFVLDSPNKALLPSVDLQVMNESCPIHKNAQACPDDGLQTICRIESTSESKKITSEKPMKAKEGNLSADSKQAAVMKQSVLSRPSGLKLPSGLNRKGNMHALSSSKPYEYSCKKNLSLHSAKDIKQSRGVSLNNPVNLRRDFGRSVVVHSKPNKGKPPMVLERKIPSAPFKSTSAANVKLLANTNRAASTVKSSSGEISDKPILPGNRLQLGSNLSARSRINFERGTSERLKGKGSEKQFQTAVTSVKHLNSSTTSTIQNGAQPKKLTFSNVKR
ncbi:G2 and S phase-expressed protein 1-like [Narcine bancroftii]|uniref:G2 and S phase-expressed protein 1-like n=1 Tax=Narcine bancroftii TaxID=1343680 RepID=UPI003831A233